MLMNHFYSPHHLKWNIINILVSYYCCFSSCKLRQFLKYYIFCKSRKNSFFFERVSTLEFYSFLSKMGGLFLFLLWLRFNNFNIMIRIRLIFWVEFIYCLNLWSSHLIRCHLEHLVYYPIARNVKKYSIFNLIDNISYEIELLKLKKNL